MTPPISGVSSSVIWLTNMALAKQMRQQKAHENISSLPKQGRNTVINKYKKEAQ